MREILYAALVRHVESTAQSGSLSLPVSNDGTDDINHSTDSINGEGSMATLFKTDGSWAGLILRVGLGSVIFAHGAQKLLGWFGGNGFDGTMGFFTQKMGLPWLVAFLVIIGESLGSLGLIAGFLTRVTAASFIVIMLGAIAAVHWPYGFFMNWFGQQQGEGFEFHLLVIAMSAALVTIGGGKWAVDGVIARRLEQGERVPQQPERKAA